MVQFLTNWPMGKQ